MKQILQSGASLLLTFFLASCGTRRRAKNKNPSAELVMAPLNYVSFERGETQREGACVQGYMV